MLPATEKQVSKTLKQITADIVAAFVERSAIERTELQGFIKSVYQALADAEAHISEAGQHSHNQNPAVDPKKSVFKDHIVCLEDGKHFKTLKRHLTADHNMTPEHYREKWRLPANYPMIAEEYATERSSLAKHHGLGKKVASLRNIKREGDRKRDFRVAPQE
jgi:predicted transcriptional regulator